MNIASAPYRCSQPSCAFLAVAALHASISCDIYCSPPRQEHRMPFEERPFQGRVTSRSMEARAFKPLCVVLHRRASQAVD